MSAARRMHRVQKRRERCAAEREVAAYHEAGHAVARVALGRPAAPVWVNDRGEGYSGTAGRREIGRKDAPLAMTYLEMSLAGPIAEARHTGQALDEILRGSGYADYFAALQLLAWLGTQGYKAPLGDYLDFAAILVDDHWPAIERVARALVAERKLDAARVAELVGDVGEISAP